MQNQNQVVEDLSRLVTSLAGTVAGMGREAEARIKGQFRDFFSENFVTREEYEALKALASETRTELEKLKEAAGADASGKSASDGGDVSDSGPGGGAA